MTKIKRHARLIVLGFIVLILGIGSTVACSSDRETVQKNIAAEADNFTVLRRVLVVNLILGRNELAVEGYCAIDDQGAQLEVICKRGAQYIKDLYGKGDNAIYLVEQLDTSGVSPDHYAIVFQPQKLIPGKIIT